MEHAQVAHAAAAAAAATGREGEVDRSVGEEGQAAITMATAADVVVVASSSPRLSGRCRPSSPAFPSPNTEETVRFPPPAVEPLPPRPADAPDSLAIGERKRTTKRTMETTTTPRAWFRARRGRRPIRGRR